MVSDTLSTSGSSHEQTLVLEETFVTESASDSTQSLAEGRVDQPPPYSSLLGRLASPPGYLDIMQEQSGLDIATIFGTARETDVV